MPASNDNRPVGKDNPLFGLLDGFVNIHGGPGKNMENASANFTKIVAIGRRDKQYFTGEELAKLKPFLEHDPLSDDITKQMWFSGRQLLLMKPGQREAYTSAGPHHDYTLFEIAMVAVGARIVRKPVEGLGTHSGIRVQEY